MAENVDIAVLKNDLKWIKDKLTSIETTVNNTKACVDGHDNRIQSLENWKKFCDAQFNKNMAKWGILIALISIGITVGLKLLGI